MTTSPTEKTFASGSQSGAAQRSTSQGKLRVGHRGRVGVDDGRSSGVVHRLVAHGHRPAVREYRRQVEGHPGRDDRHADDPPVEDGRDDEEPVRGDPEDEATTTWRPPRETGHRERDDLEPDRREEEPRCSQARLGQAAEAAPEERDRGPARGRTGRREDHEHATRSSRSTTVASRARGDEAALSRCASRAATTAGSNCVPE